MNRADLPGEMADEPSCEGLHEEKTTAGDERGALVRSSGSET